MGVSTDAIVFCGWLLPEYDEIEINEHDKIWEAYDCPSGALPIDVIQHCHSNSPMWAIAIPGTIHRASRGYPVEFNGYSGDYDYSGDSTIIAGAETARKYCTERLIKIGHKEPRWLICSYWDG